jgi:hypothetical protein
MLLCVSTPSGESLAGAHATPLNAEEAANWDQAKAFVGGLALGLLEGAPVEVLDATQSDLQAVPLDSTRILNALHLPDNAGMHATGLEAILRRIPDGWGRWISCGPGWYPILIDLDTALAAIDPAYEVHQVKEKFARLCYYHSAVPQDYLQDRQIEQTVQSAEDQAAITCEMCGNPGQFMATGNGTGGWYQTLCLGCAAASKRGYAPPPQRERVPHESDLRRAAWSALPRQVVCSIALTLAQDALPFYEQAYPLSFPPMSELLAIARAWDLNAVGLPSSEILAAAHQANTLAWTVERLACPTGADWRLHSMARDAARCAAAAIESIADPLNAWVMADNAVDAAQAIAVDLASQGKPQDLPVEEDIALTQAARDAFDAHVTSLVSTFSAT